jgi:hypothetical protein
MARILSGPFLGMSGTINGTTYYQLNGKTYAKSKNRTSTKPRTEGQEANSATLGMISKFLGPFEDFLKVGYQHVAKSVEMTPHNAMASHIWKKALKGKGKNRKVDLSKLLITQGNLASAKKNNVEMTAEGLAFTWSNEIKPRKSHHSDQVIMLAYFPELEEVKCKIGGAERSVGKDFLPLDSIEKGYAAEIFISFAADDHADLANSIYLGQLNW